MTGTPLVSRYSRVRGMSRIDLTPAQTTATGVRESSFVILFLSQGVLERPFVLFELEQALQAKKQVLLVLIFRDSTTSPPLDLNFQVISSLILKICLDFFS